MELLLEIRDPEILDESTLKIREASRAIIFDENNLIPLLFVSKYNYHKLPGGGIEAGEEKMSALKREVLEETGCTIEIMGGVEIGKILEFRFEHNLKQTSYCYLGKIISKGKPDFTNEELNNGFKIIWLPLDEAISKVQNDQPKNHEGAFFIQKRDLRFLQKAKELINSL